MSSKNQKVSLLDGYIAATDVLTFKECMQDNVVDILLDNMAHSIAITVSERKKEFPKEDCLFVLTCKIYKVADYKKAHPAVFKEGGD